MLPAAASVLGGWRLKKYSPGSLWPAQAWQQLTSCGFLLSSVLSSAHPLVPFRASAEVMYTLIRNTIFGYRPLHGTSHTPKINTTQQFLSFTFALELCEKAVELKETADGVCHLLSGRSGGKEAPMQAPGHLCVDPTFKIKGHGSSSGLALSGKLRALLPTKVWHIFGVQTPHFPIHVFSARRPWPLSILRCHRR